MRIVHTFIIGDGPHRQIRNEIAVRNHISSGTLSFLRTGNKLFISTTGILPITSSICASSSPVGRPGPPSRFFSSSLVFPKQSVRNPWRNEIFEVGRFFALPRPRRKKVVAAPQLYLPPPPPETRGRAPAPNKDCTEF